MQRQIEHLRVARAEKLQQKEDMFRHQRILRDDVEAQLQQLEAAAADRAGERAWRAAGGRIPAGRG